LLWALRHAAAFVYHGLAARQPVYSCSLLAASARLPPLGGPTRVFLQLYICVCISIKFVGVAVVYSCFVESRKEQAREKSERV